MERAGALEQHRLALWQRGVGHAAVDRADLGARLLVVEADALGTLLGDDVEDVVGDRRMHRPVGCLPLDPALVDGGVRALRLAGAAVDALAGDDRRHLSSNTIPPTTGSNRLWLGPWLGDRGGRPSPRRGGSAHEKARVGGSGRARLRGRTRPRPRAFPPGARPGASPRRGCAAPGSRPRPLRGSYSRA